MSTSHVEEDLFLSIDTEFYQQQIEKVVDYFLPYFFKTLRRFTFFNGLFLGVITAEVFVSLFLFSYFEESYFLAFWLGFLFLTVSSYFICRSYLQARRPEYIAGIQNKFIKSCKHLIHYREGIPEHQLALANACFQFDARLKGKEYSLYKPPQMLDCLENSLQNFSCRLHWQDVYHLRNSLLQTAIEEHIKLVKFQPTSLEVHASLANAYVLQARLYLDPKRQGACDQEKWVPPELFLEKTQLKFQKISKKAVEELIIIKNFSPNDPWIHTQLALSYRDLNMPQEEIREYEALLKLCPADKETLFKLGSLYFQEGMNAKGLQIYEQLKEGNYARAEKLIQFYQ